MSLDQLSSYQLRAFSHSSSLFDSERSLGKLRRTATNQQRRSSDGNLASESLARELITES